MIRKRGIDDNIGETPHKFIKVEHDFSDIPYDIYNVIFYYIPVESYPKLMVLSKNVYNIIYNKNQIYLLHNFLNNKQLRKCHSLPASDFITENSYLLNDYTNHSIQIHKWITSNHIDHVDTVKHILQFTHFEYSILKSYKSNFDFLHPIDMIFQVYDKIITMSRLGGDSREERR